VDKFMLKKQLTQINAANNIRIRRKDAATDTKPNMACYTFKLILKI
jgi:hypothetical protein